jgi:uncharacterized membrane protein YoaK (UPF0700 family)
MAKTILDRLAVVDERHGPLPVLLLGLTVLTGLVDAVSYLRLGHVFVANMTGNVVFLGFATAGVKDFSVPASLTAMAAFLVGALIGGMLSRRHARHRGYLFWVATASEAVLIVAALAASLLVVDVADPLLHYNLIILLGLVMGLQNAVVRRLGVPDLTTTVLTLTLTGLAADDATSGGGTRLRRLASIVAMFAGAALGGVLVLQINVTAVLAAALVLLLVIAAVAFYGRASDRAWALAK